MRGKRGFALVLTLVLTALMVAVTVELIHQVYVDTSLNRSFRDGQQASVLVVSGAESGAKLLGILLGNQGFSSLTDKWAVPVKLVDEVGVLDVVVTEENAKINLNALVLPNGELDPFIHAALKRLGKRFSIPDAAWLALADWLDTNDIPRTGGGEALYYTSLKPSYSPRNGQLATLRELSLVKGFTAGMIASLHPFVTALPSQSGVPWQVNLNTAPKEVLSALHENIDDRMAERIIIERKLKPFSTPAELSRISSLDAVSISLLGNVSVKGTLFRIVTVARVRDAGRSVESVVRISGRSTEILSWQEY